MLDRLQSVFEYNHGKLICSLDIQNNFKVSQSTAVRWLNNIANVGLISKITNLDSKKIYFIANRPINTPVWEYL
jgi:Fic family protein